MKRQYILGMVVLLGLITVLVSLSTTTAEEPTVIELEFRTFIEAGSAEQDVFVSGACGMAYRVTLDSPLTALDQPIYALANPEDYVFDPHGLYTGSSGPHALGKPLDMTMREWLAASGEGTYTIHGDRAIVDLSFAGLVPGGTYSLECAHFYHKTDSFAVVRWPCDIGNTACTSFTANAQGTLHVHGTMRALTEATVKQIPVIALVWHAEDEPQATHTRRFGNTLFMQLHTLVVSTETRRMITRTPGEPEQEPPIGRVLPAQ